MKVSGHVYVCKGCQFFLLLWFAIRLWSCVNRLFFFFLSFFTSVHFHYIWGPKKGPRGGLKWLIILIFKNLLLVNQQCQKIDNWHITLINLENRNPVWPNEFDLQLGCCISDAFSSLVYVSIKHFTYLSTDNFLSLNVKQ